MKTLTDIIGQTTVKTTGAEHAYLTTISNLDGSICVLALPANDENQAVVNHTYVVGQVKEGSMGYFETIQTTMDDEE